STTVSFVGGDPDGFAIFGFFFVSVPTASASFVTSAVGFAKVAAVVVGVVVVSLVVVAALEPVSAPAPGMAAVLVPPPHAAKPIESAARAGHFRAFICRITAATLLSVSQ